MKQNKFIVPIILIIILTIVIFIGLTYAYFDLNIKAEESSTMTIGGAEISANFVSTNSITIEEALPSDSPIGFKDFSITTKNTSNNSYKLYLKTVIDYSTFTNTENDGVLYYDVKSGSNYSTTVKSKTMFPTIPAGKAILSELTIPANTNGSTAYRLNLYFPKSTKIQNKNGQLVLNASISVESDNSLKYTPTLLKKIDLMYQYESGTNGLEQDDTPDKNLRYVGASPKNYIKFNNETWRIIGVFNNITTIDEQENEKTESLVKIVRNYSLGDYSWDSSESTKNDEYGINEWSQADLMYELNCDGKSTKYCCDDITEGYLSNLTTGSTTWYNGSNNSKNGTYEYRKNIRSLSIDKVAKVRWNLGGYNTPSVSALNMYNAERGTLHVINPSDGITRTNTWDGKIALIYPSDYGYASTDTTCRGGLRSYDSNYNGYCKNENWLFNGENQWTLSPNSGNAFCVFVAGSGGNVYSGNLGIPRVVLPVLFLKSDVVIAGGTGESIENAYTLK